MHALQLLQPGPLDPRRLQPVELPKPVPGPGQVRVRVHACGVCRTDLHTVEGDLALPRLPLVPGHQVVGAVDAVGPGVRRLAPGARVGVGWLNHTCGACAFCRRGLENLCPHLVCTGLHVDGGYAEWLLVDERYAFELPAGLTDVAAAPLLCGGIIGYRTLRLSEIEPGGRLGLYGFGASAHQALQVAVHWGCQVFVFTRSTAHRRLATRLGAAWTGAADESPPAALDAAAIFAPAGQLVPRALGHLRPGGTIAVNAIHMSAIPEFLYGLLYGERTVRSVTNFTRRDAEEFLALAAAIPVRTEVEVFPLNAAVTALQKLAASELLAAAVLTV